MPNGLKFADYLEEHASKKLKEIVKVDLGQQVILLLPVSLLSIVLEATADVSLGTCNMFRMSIALLSNFDK